MEVFNDSCKEIIFVLIVVIFVVVPSLESLLQSSPSSSSKSLSSSLDENFRQKVFGVLSHKKILSELKFVVGHFLDFFGRDQLLFDHLSLADWGAQ